jgi:hypothetical protein
MIGKIVESLVGLLSFVGGSSLLQFICVFRVELSDLQAGYNASVSCVITEYE